MNFNKNIKLESTSSKYNDIIKRENNFAPSIKFSDKIKEVLNKSNPNSNDRLAPVKHFEDNIKNYISRCLSINTIPDINKIYDKKESDFLNVYKNQDTYEDQIKVIKNNGEIYNKIKEKESKFHRLYAELSDERDKMKIQFIKESNKSNNTNSTNNTNKFNQKSNENRNQKHDFSIYTDQYLSKDEMINKREVEKALKSSNVNGKIVLKCNYDKQTEGNILNVERIDSKTNLLNKKRHESNLIDKLKKDLNLSQRQRTNHLSNTSISINKSKMPVNSNGHNHNLTLKEKIERANMIKKNLKTHNMNNMGINHQNKSNNNKDISNINDIRKKRPILPKKTILSNINEQQEEKLVISKIPNKPKNDENENNKSNLEDQKKPDDNNKDKYDNSKIDSNNQKNSSKNLENNLNTNSNFKNKLNVIKQENLKEKNEKQNKQGPSQDVIKSAKVLELKEKVKSFVKSNSNNKLDDNSNEKLAKYKKYGNYSDEEDDYIEDDFVVKDKIHEKYSNNLKKIKNTKYYSDDDDVMEVGFDEIEKEEARTARIGDEEDYKEYLKEKMKKKKKVISN